MIQDAETWNHSPKSPNREAAHEPQAIKSQGPHGSVNKSRKPTVLIVDDESQIREVIAELVSENYDTIQAENAGQAIAKARQKTPSPILLDVMMPGKNGIEACEQLRKYPETRHIPIIMLTAASSVDIRIRSIMGGADDFIAKPFNADELITRIESKIRRFQERRTKSVRSWSCGNHSISKNEPFAQVDEQHIQLSPVEHSILKILVKNTDTLVNRAQMMKAWGDESSDDRLIDAHLTSLRKKLAGLTGTIRAVYGKGYVLTVSSANTD